MYLHQVHKEIFVFHFIFDHDLGELTVVLGWNFAGRIGLYNTVQILLFFYLWPPLPNTNLNIQSFEAYQESVLQNSLELSSS